MAVLNKYKLRVEEKITPVTLTASDTVKVSLTLGSVLFIDNVTAGTLSLNIKGDTATTTECPGVGTIALSLGHSYSVPAGEVHKVPLNPQIQKWLGDGNLTITGGDGAEAYIIEG